MPGPSLLTDEEQLLVRQAVFLPIMDEFVSGDIAVMAQSDLNLREAIIGALGELQEMGRRDALDCRAKLKLRGIKIYEEHRTDRGLAIRFLCRGRQYQIHWRWEIIRAELLVEVCRYMQIDIGKKERA